MRDSACPFWVKCAFTITEEGDSRDNTLCFVGNNSMGDRPGSPTLKLLLQAAKNQIPKKLGLAPGAAATIANVTIVAIIRKGNDGFLRDYPPPADPAERKRKSTPAGTAPILTRSELSTASNDTISASQRQDPRPSGPTFLPHTHDDSMDLDNVNGLVNDLCNSSTQPAAKVAKPR